MGSDSRLKVLLVAEGSGGHLIPALQVAHTLAGSGAQATVWYAQRAQTAPLALALAQQAREASVQIDAIPDDASTNPLARLWRCRALWRRAERCFDTFAPDVVVGFGGWMSAPIVLAARARGIGCLLHEQNVVMGRTNRLLSRWVNRVAVSFKETQPTVRWTPSVMTGLPVRRAIGQMTRAEAAARFQFDPERPTLLVLGGSQGSRCINRLMLELVGQLSAEERRAWQIVHMTGSAEEQTVREAYAARQLRAWVGGFLPDMEAAYAHADLVVGRAGASTIAELARCGMPAILIPYPHAGGHQRANARAVEAVGGGIVIEESEATVERLLADVRKLLGDARLRAMMGRQIQAMRCSDAAERITDAIVELGRQTTLSSHAARGAHRAA